MSRGGPRPIDEAVVVREEPVPLGPITWSNSLCSCNGNARSCCRACCCPLLSLSELAEQIESNVFGKENRKQNFQCAGLFAYFCCCPELLCFLTLLLREEIKGKVMDQEKSLKHEETYRRVVAFHSVACVAPSDKWKKK